MAGRTGPAHSPTRSRAKCGVLLSIHPSCHPPRPRPWQPRASRRGTRHLEVCGDVALHPTLSSRMFEVTSAHWPARFGRVWPTDLGSTLARLCPDLAKLGPHRASFAVAPLCQHAGRRTRSWTSPQPREVRSWSLTGERAGPRCACGARHPARACARSRGVSGLLPGLGRLLPGRRRLRRRLSIRVGLKLAALGPALTKVGQRCAKSGPDLVNIGYSLANVGELSAKFGQSRSKLVSSGPDPGTHWRSSAKLRKMWLKSDRGQTR